MEKKNLQKLIDSETKTRSQMLEIAKCYLNGDVLRDKVAAEAWLMCIIEQGDSPEAVHAMELLTGEILKKEMPISEADYADMRRALECAGEDEREVIQEWMKLYEKDKKTS